MLRIEKAMVFEPNNTPYLNFGQPNMHQFEIFGIQLHPKAQWWSLEPTMRKLWLALWTNWEFYGDGMEINTWINLESTLKTKQQT